MQLEDKIKIDILEFIKTGKFDYIKIGKTKDWILMNFPDPDDAIGAIDVLKNDIWCYGDIEFHFNKDELYLIHTDNIRSFDGGESLELNKWIFSKPDSLYLSYVIDCLIHERIDFRIENQVFGKISTINLSVIESGVKFGFSLMENLEQQDQESSQKVKNKSGAEAYYLHGLSLVRP
jgi:hypothetical protein